MIAAVHNWRSSVDHNIYMRLRRDKLPIDAMLSLLSSYMPINYRQISINANSYSMNIKIFNKKDIPAGVVVFLVALPLCLGVALASGAPLISGVIGGIIGGIVVGSLSGSPLGVSGPAAGLTVIVLESITDLGGFEIFLTAVILSGVIQLIFGFLKAGIIAHYFPSSVIHGMLAGIGISIVLSQLPLALGIAENNTIVTPSLFKEGASIGEWINSIMDNIHLGATITSTISIAILLLWSGERIKKSKILRLIPGALIAVVVGIFTVKYFSGNILLSLSEGQMVQLPELSSIKEIGSIFTFPDLSVITDPLVLKTAFIIALIGSLETLLSVEAIDQQDSKKRITPTNRELKAQGVGNILSGLIGGLPITQVIVRSSANQQAGGETKFATIFHGILLLISVVTIGPILNMIPLGTLAAILIIIGVKLASPSLIKRMKRQGREQLIPFLVTVSTILIFDLLTGVLLGLAVATFIILINNYKTPYHLSEEFSNIEDIDRQSIRIRLAQDVTFLNKASLQKALNLTPDNSNVIIDASRTLFLHPDIVDIIDNFIINAHHRGVTVKTLDLYNDKREMPILHFQVEIDGGDSDSNNSSSINSTKV